MSEYVPVAERDARVIRGAVAFLSGACDEAPSTRDARLEVLLDTGRREFYSYGRHFPLARYVPRNANGRRRPPLWIINGDAWRGSGTWGHPSRTWDHQSVTREAIRASGIDSIVLPFSALTGAGIDLDTIRPIHVRADAEWDETRYADVLADVPRWERTVNYQVERESRDAADIPARYRTEWRERTADELAEYAARSGFDSAESVPDWQRRATLPILPDTAGIYHWREARTKDRARDEDGRYSWDVHVHRLGDSLFSAVRVDADGRRRTARFLSSFDTNENPPLYFLAQVPRGAGSTVESAIDSLAPRAVHAAIARGRRVYRQGDIFLVETSYTREDLAAAGARFARLTLWDRDARPRADEITGHRPLSAKERRARDAREARYRRRLWREAWRAREASAAREDMRRALARIDSREAWDLMRARHADERRAALAAGAAIDSPLSVRCETCGADVGARCYRIPEDGAAMPESMARRINSALDWNAAGAHDVRSRDSLAARQSREFHELRRETAREAPRAAGPVSRRGIRRERATAVAESLARLERERAALRRAVLRIPAARRCYGESAGDARRRLTVQAIENARRDYAGALESLTRASLKRVSARDAYRHNEAYRLDGAGAAMRLYADASRLAAERFRPEEVRFDGAAFQRRREAIRAAVRIYGTAHTATELAHVRGAVYARGRVRHRPELENTNGRWRDPRPDHHSFTLGDGSGWYLALRNRVPRQ